MGGRHQGLHSPRKKAHSSQVRPDGHTHRPVSEPSLCRIIRDCPPALTQATLAGLGRPTSGSAFAGGEADGSDAAQPTSRAAIKPSTASPSKGWFVVVFMAKVLIPEALVVKCRESGR